MNKYDVKYIKLDITAEANNRFIAGTALTRARAVQNVDTFAMELKNNMIIDSVFINGEKMNFIRGNDHVLIPQSPVMTSGTIINALFYYQGTANSNGIRAGTVSSNGLVYTASLSESYQAREWFPAKQQLVDKIDSADIWITTTATNKVGSNGLLKAVVDKPGNKKQYQWSSRYPIAYYLLSFSVGNYMEYNNYAKPAAMAPDSILIQHYIVDNTTYFNANKANIDKTPAFVEKLSELYGLYPFKNEKYGHSHANIGGGLEIM
jgi:aminopeptidase N